MAELLLDVRNLQAGYGEVQVLWGVDLQVPLGGIACIVGSNGAGKTTLLRALSGLVAPMPGSSAKLGGRELCGLAPGAVLAAGLAHVPEGRRLFRGMSVRDNLLAGAHLRRDSAVVKRDLEHVFANFPILAQRSGQDATTLSGGEQQMCAIGRGIMSRPQLLMIDELSLGLSPVAVESLGDALRAINATGTTILLVEQDVATAFELAATGVVMETGRVAKAGATNALADDPAVRQAYLGL